MATGTEKRFKDQVVQMESMELGGTAVTATAAEINAIAGTGLDATELGYLNGVVAGTAAADKAVVLNSSKGVTTITSATITTLTSTTVNSAALTGTTTLTMTSANAAALAVGLAGATNPAFVVDSSTGSQAAGLKVTGAVAAGTVAAAVISSGSDANLTLNAKGTGTIGIGSVSTGAVTITPATTVTGALTPTGGVTAAGGFSVGPRTVHSGGASPATATTGTDTTPSVTETHIVEIFVPSNMTATGIALLNGSATAGNYQLSMADSTGAVIAAAQTASTAGSGTAAYQRIPFAVAWAATGPATYYVLLQNNNTGNRFRTHAAGNFGASVKTGETFGAFTAVTPPTTFTADKGPICSLY